MPKFPCTLADETVWKWISHLLHQPEFTEAGICEAQQASAKSTRLLQARLKIITDILADTEKHLAMLLDLYLEQNIAKVVYLERKLHLEQRITVLNEERNEMLQRLQSMAFSDEQMEAIEQFLTQSLECAEYPSFEDKQHYLQILDVHCTATVENDERVIYVTCQLGKQRLKLGAIWPS